MRAKNQRWLSAVSISKEEAKVLVYSWIPLDKESQWMVLTVKDITAKIKETVEKDPNLEAYLAAKQQEFGRQISTALQHEINNPLTVVLGNAQLLKFKEGEEISPEDRKSLRQIEKAAKQIQWVVATISYLLSLPKPPLKKYRDGQGRMMINIHEQE